MKLFAVIYAIIIIAGFLCLIHAIISGIIDRLIWKYDERHPDARRQCRHCGNRQLFYIYYTEPEIPIGWEFDGRVKACNKCKPDPDIVGL